MAFTCTLCSQPQKAGIKPYRVTVAEKEVFYENKVRREDEFGRFKEELVHSSGTEILSEATLCPKCANIPQPLPAALDMKLFKAITNGSHKHARNCEGITKRKVRGVSIVEPCQMCKKIIDAFSEFPSPALAVCLENPLASPASFYLSTLILDSMMSRTMDKGKKAQRDVAAAGAILKANESRGGRA